MEPENIRAENLPSSDQRRSPIRKSQFRAYDVIQKLEKSLEEPHTSLNSSSLIMLSILLNLTSSVDDSYTNSSITYEFETVKIHPSTELYKLSFNHKCRKFSNTAINLFKIPRTIDKLGGSATNSSKRSNHVRNQGM